MPIRNVLQPAVRSRLVRKQELGALLVSSLPNIRYLTGFAGSTALALVTPARCYLLLDSRYLEQAARARLNARIVPVATDAWDCVARLAARLRVRRLGFESAHTPYERYQALRKALPGAELVPVSGLVETERRFKRPAELAAVRRALRVTEQVFSEILLLIRPGVRERELAAELELRVRRLGAESMSFETLVASGPRSSLPHGRAGDRRFRKGDPIVIDFGIFMDGYASDFTRTVVLGRADRSFRRHYEAVRLALEEALRSRPAGKPAAWLDGICRDSLGRSGLDRFFVHGTGHGVGLEIHEGPRIGARSSDVLLAGDLFTLEPGVYLPGKFGVRLEDMAVISSRGLRRLNRAGLDLIEL